MHIKFWLIIALLFAPQVWARHHVGHHLQQRVFFSQDKHTIIAVDTQTGRSIEFRLRVRENIIAVQEAEVIIAVATDQRLLAFSINTGGWRAFNLELKEQVIRLTARDFSIFVDTTRRIITFNGLTGVWFARRKSIR